MKKSIYIEGFYDRLDEACYRSGMKKCEIARVCGFDRKILCGERQYMMNSGYLAKFCAVTNTSADWLLGLRRDES